MKYLIALAAVLALSGCVSRNVPIEDRIDEVEASVKALQELGVSGRLIFIWGTGHIAGQAFNVSGSSGFGEIIVPQGEAD